jgi:uncharacterized protein YkwD
MVKRRNGYISVGVVLTLAFGFFLFWLFLLDGSFDIRPKLQPLNQPISILAPAQLESYTPPTLKQEDNALSAVANRQVLSAKEVIRYTNQYRADENLEGLKESYLLNKAAQQKLQDMFDRQYFDHVGPDGSEVSFWVTKNEYEYLKIGENLALGGFRNNAELVEGWMNSPGHRKNILTPSYLEIGVAVGRGMMNGEQTWLAVQIFGTTKEVCPDPDLEIKERIDRYSANIATMKQELEEIEKTIEEVRRQQREELIEEYNQLVGVYNSMIEAVQVDVAEYNNQIQEFNNCAQNYK